MCLETVIILLDKGVYVSMFLYLCVYIVYTYGRDNCEYQCIYVCSD